MTFWAYILRCADDSYYTGHSDDLERRIAQHDAGEVPGYTHAFDFAQRGWRREKRRLPLRLRLAQPMRALPPFVLSEVEAQPPVPPRRFMLSAV